VATDSGAGAAGAPERKRRRHRDDVKRHGPLVASGQLCFRDGLSTCFAIAHGGCAIEASLCYDTRMKKRPGGTTHLSISLPTEEAKILKRRAKRVYGGNVSHVVSDAIRYIAYEEGRDALIASFGGKGKPTAEEARQLDAEWGLAATKSA